MDELISHALAFGFSHAALLRCDTLELRREVRDMCSADRCQRYGRSWMCPPACGTLEENAERLKGYGQGLIVQTTGVLEDDFDYERMQEAGARQKQWFTAFRRVLVKRFPNLLALTSGGCALCDACSYPDRPCKRPEDAMPSMEAFGLVVSDVCRFNGIEYYYGPRTITFTGCYILK